MLNRLGSLALTGQPILEKDNSEFKTKSLSLTLFSTSFWQLCSNTDDKFYSFFQLGNVSIVKRALGDAEHPFIAIAPRSTLTQDGIT